jgi:hypothetical protein
MASQNLDGMISMGGRWWSFPGAQIDLYSSEFEWRDGKLWLHESTGNVIEGTEVSEHRALAERHGLRETDVF